MINLYNCYLLHYQTFEFAGNSSVGDNAHFGTNSVKLQFFFFDKKKKKKKKKNYQRTFSLRKLAHAIT